MASTVDVENVPEVTGYMTEERRMIQEVARDFTLKEVLPVANELDPVQGDIPMDLRTKMGEMGYFGIRTPEEYGGLGLGVFEYCLIAEELARGWMSVPGLINSHLIMAYIVKTYGTEDQKKNYLRAILYFARKHPELADHVSDLLRDPASLGG